MTIPCVKGVSEAPSRVFHHHGVATAMKPHLTLKRILIYPKDKRTTQENTGVVYEVPCKDCPRVYTGETEKRYRVLKGKETPIGCEIIRGGEVHMGQKEGLRL